MHKIDTCPLKLVPDNVFAILVDVYNNLLKGYYTPGLVIFCC